MLNELSILNNNNKKFNYLELENGLLSIEHLILIELSNFKDGIESGFFLGLMISKYDLLDIRKLKFHLKNLCLGEINLINIESKINEVDINNLKFTTEILNLSDLGNFLIDLKNIYNIDFPLSLIRSRLYDLNKNDNFIYKNISLDRQFLFNFLNNDKDDLTDICFSKELGYSYLNETDSLNNLLKSGKCTFSYLKSYSINYSLNEYYLYDDFINPILYKDKTDLLKDVKSSISMNYLFLSESGEVILKSLEKVLSDFKSIYNSLTEFEKDKLLNILINDYKIIENKSIVNMEIYRLIYSFSDRKIYLLNSDEFLKYNLNSFDSVYNFSLSDYEYYVVYEDCLKRLDITNLNFILNDINILGILSLPLVNKNSKNLNIFYLVNEDGEIKAVNSSEFRLRNKQVVLKNCNSKRIIKVLEFNTSCLSDLNKGILLLTKNGYIKILNLLEYKIKNKSSQYVMGINLDEDDKVVFVSSLNLDDSILSLNIDNEIYTFEVYNLLSSKINKGKRIKNSLDIDLSKCNIKMNLIGE